MKPHGFSLNPFATSYIPLSKREANTERTGANFPGYSEHYMHNPPFDNISPRLNMRHGEKSPVAIASAVKNHPLPGSLSPHSSEMEMMDREINLDLEFLQANFPGLSEQSINDVYFANRGDLDSAMDMLTHLENNHPPEFEYDPESLPDTLDIGDISESGFAAVDQPSFKSKKVDNDASTSSRV